MREAGIDPGGESGQKRARHGERKHGHEAAAGLAARGEYPARGKKSATGHVIPRLNTAGLADRIG
jgi:hypothetical protein